MQKAWPFELDHQFCLEKGVEHPEGRSCAKPCDKGEHSGSKAWEGSHDGQSGEIRVCGVICGGAASNIDHFWRFLVITRAVGSQLLRKFSPG